MSKSKISKSKIVCALMLLLASCSDFLEITPLETIVLDKFWNEEADVENVIAGCYSSMQEQTVVDRMMTWGEFRSDNIVGATGIENETDLANIFKENINASNAFTKWGEFYNIINRCNTVIYYAPTVAERDPSYTESKKNATVAEASAIRDLMYFYLIRAFRDVPFTTQPYLDNTQQLDLPATSFDTVLDSLIIDLENVQANAVKRYPSTKSGYQHGRITQDAIHAMLADMYLWKQDYPSAVRYADMVIQSKTSEYQDELNKMSGVVSSNAQMIDGFPLIQDKYTAGNYYGEAANEIFGEGDSRESILELIYSDNDQMLANNAVSYRYGNSETFPGNVRPADFICTDVSDQVFKVFLNEYDARSFENMQSANGSASLYGIAKYTYQSTMVDLTKAQTAVVHSNAYSKSYCHANWILYRLSDIMLLKAEALVEMIDESDTSTEGVANNNSYLKQAFDIVNAISKRSNFASSNDLDATQYTTKSTMQDLVIEERQRELMFEGKRWFDLVRRVRRDGSTNYLVGVVSRKGNSGGSAIASKLSRMEAVFWPYHNDEIKVNTNLVQNPAFGSGEDGSIQKTK